MNEKSLEQENNFLKEMIRTYYQPEIERLTKQNKALNEMYELTKNYYIRLHSIIKEVREYIENNTDNTNFLEVPSKELLEILKGEDKE